MLHICGWEAVDLLALCWSSGHTRGVWVKQHKMTWHSKTPHSTTQFKRIKPKTIEDKHETTQTKTTCQHTHRGWVQTDPQSLLTAGKQQLMSNAVYLLFSNKVPFSGTELKSEHTSVWHLKQLETVTLSVLREFLCFILWCSCSSAVNNNFFPSLPNWTVPTFRPDTCFKGCFVFGCLIFSFYTCLCWAAFAYWSNQGSTSRTLQESYVMSEGSDGQGEWTTEFSMTK